jgi:hypothetical protein
MPADSLRKWRFEMGQKLRLDSEPLSEREACELLGISRQGYRNNEINGASLAIALACAALLADVKPYGIEPKEK